jgi:hypothetical protein
MEQERMPLHRDSKRGIIFGVAAGLAESFGINPMVGRAIRHSAAGQCARHTRAVSIARASPTGPFLCWRGSAAGSAAEPSGNEVASILDVQQSSGEDAESLTYSGG